MQKENDHRLHEKKEKEIKDKIFNTKIKFKHELIKTLDDKLFGIEILLDNSYNAEEKKFLLKNQHKDFFIKSLKEKINELRKKYWPINLFINIDLNYLGLVAKLKDILKTDKNIYLEINENNLKEEYIPIFVYLNKNYHWKFFLDDAINDNKYDSLLNLLSFIEKLRSYWINIDSIKTDVSFIKKTINNLEELDMFLLLLYNYWIRNIIIEGVETEDIKNKIKKIKKDFPVDLKIYLQGYAIH